ncbi:MAG TPA: polyhydroxyalkanoic acid system family protein [Casimicrobiaceae bacterium]|nr:polyhydroxyalkanoic acid system family protein [Casimicrobiaceae bacterium]
MPSISIRRRHELDHKHAKAAARKVAKDLDKRFGLTSQWDGDDVEFSGAGVSGKMHVGKSQIRLDVELSFLLVALRGTIERHINNELDAVLKGGG